MAQVAVVGFPDEVLRGRVCAFVLTRDGEDLTLNELHELIHGVTSPRIMEIAKPCMRAVRSASSRSKFRRSRRVRAGVQATARRGRT